MHKSKWRWLTIINSFYSISITKPFFSRKWFMPEARLKNRREICIDQNSKLLQPVCCKKQQNKVPDQLLVYRIPLKDLNDSKVIVYESKGFSWPFRINFIPFRIFRGPLFHKPVTGQELIFTVSYSKPALGTWWLN